MENKEIKLETGGIIVFHENDKPYRILYVSEGILSAIEMETTKTNVVIFDCSYIIQGLLNGDCHLEDADYKVFELESLDEKQRDSYTIKKEIVEKIDGLIGPDFTKIKDKKCSNLINDLSKTYKFSTMTIWTIIRKYLQSGLSLVSLVDGRLTQSTDRNSMNYSRKTGVKNGLGIQKGIPLTNAVREQFDEAIKEYKKGRQHSYREVFENIVIAKYYSKIVQYSDGHYELKIFPDNEKPTYNQFYTYAHKQITPDKMSKIKTSQQEFRNNQRLLLSDSLKNVKGPGDLVEMDEVELDVSLVSSVDPNKSVGRPIVYCMIDVYTRVILAVSVAFENNSVEGLTNCFINLGEDKVEFCKKYGFEIQPEVWPSNIRPKRIRTDQGSEYESDAAERIFNELKINREIVTAGTGSLKGVVEQSFHQEHRTQNAILENKGLITKRHDSKHHEQAILDIYNITRMVITYVISHNCLAIERYKMTKDMISKGIKPIPTELWKYGCEKYGNPRSIPNKEQYFYNLLTEAKGAKISKRGIYFNGLYYINKNDKELFHEMSYLMNKTADFECRKDIRDVSYLYYIRNNKVQIAYLNQDMTGNADYKGLSWREYEEYKLKKKEIMQSVERQNQEIRIQRSMVYQNEVDSIEPREIAKADTKNLIESRKSEQMKWKHENSMANRVFSETVPQIETTKAVEPQPVYKKMTAQEALELFDMEQNAKYGITYEEDD